MTAGLAGYLSTGETAGEPGSEPDPTPTRMLLPTTTLAPGLSENGGPPPVGDSEPRPRDPDGDGTFEDVDGDEPVDAGDRRRSFTRSRTR